MSWTALWASASKALGSLHVGCELCGLAFCLLGPLNSLIRKGRGRGRGGWEVIIAITSNIMHNEFLFVTRAILGKGI